MRMAYDIKITLKKAAIAFVLAGIAGTITYLSNVTSQETSILVAVAVPILRAIEDVVKHYND